MGSGHRGTIRLFGRLLKWETGSYEPLGKEWSIGAHIDHSPGVVVISGGVHRRAGYLLLEW